MSFGDYKKALDAIDEVEKAITDSWWPTSCEQTMAFRCGVGKGLSAARDKLNLLWQEAEAEFSRFYAENVEGIDINNLGMEE